MHDARLMMGCSLAIAWSKASLQWKYYFIDAAIWEELIFLWKNMASTRWVRILYVVCQTNSLRQPVNVIWKAWFFRVRNFEVCEVQRGLILFNCSSALDDIQGTYIQWMCIKVELNVSHHLSFSDVLLVELVSDTSLSTRRNTKRI